MSAETGSGHGDGQAAAKRRGLDSTRRSRAFWCGVAVLVTILGFSAQFLSDWSYAYDIWFGWSPGPSTARRWFVGTSLERFVGWLSHLVLYDRVIVLLVLFACGVARSLPNTWGRWVSLLVLSSTVIPTIDGTGPWGYIPEAAQSGRFNSVLYFLSLSSVIIGVPYLAAWVVARFATPRIVTGDRCGNCGYPRTGLPSNICPECGKELTTLDSNMDGSSAAGRREG